MWVCGHARRVREVPNNTSIYRSIISAYSEFMCTKALPCLLFANSPALLQRQKRAKKERWVPGSNPLRPTRMWTMRIAAQLASAGIQDPALYALRAVQLHPDGCQFDFVWLSARTPHGGASYVW